MEAGMRAQMGKVPAAGAPPAKAKIEANSVRCKSCGKSNPIGRENCLRCDEQLPTPVEARLLTGHMSHATAVMQLESTRKSVMAMRTLFLSLAALEIIGPAVVISLMRVSLPIPVLALSACFVPFLAIAAWKVISGPVKWGIAVASVRTALTIAMVLMGGVGTTFLALNIVWTVLLWTPLPVAIAATRMLHEHPELAEYWKTGVLHPELLHRVAPR
jgi:hypothetical protein